MLKRLIIFAGYILALVGLVALLHLILRTALRRGLRVRGAKETLGIRDRVLVRYQNHPMSVWMFAYFKTRSDEMFRQLPEILAVVKDVKRILDLGCGHGFAGSYFLDRFEEAEVFGIDPSPERVTSANLAWGTRGQAIQGLAPDFDVPGLPDHFDCIFAIDMIHFLNDEALNSTLRKIRGLLNAGQHLIIRASIPPVGMGSVMWNLYKLNREMRGSFRKFRDEGEMKAILSAAGFEAQETRLSGKNAEMLWLVCRAAATESVENPP